MKTYWPALALGAYSLCGLGTAAAAPFGSFDARSAGMGNVGVATANLSGAPFFNPGMLGFQKPDEDFALLLPAVGAHIADPSGLIEDIDAFQQAVDANNQAAADAAVTRASGKAALADANAAVVIGFAGVKWAGAFTGYGYSLNGLTVTKGANDFDADPNNDSSLNLVGLRASEIGLTLARGLGPQGNRWGLGITPKYVTVKTNDYSKRLRDVATDSNDIADDPANETEETFTNVDLGFVYGNTGGWRVGLAGRNLVAKEFVTVNDRVIKMEPQARLGVGFSNHWFTWGLDVDVTENAPVSFDQKTRMAGVGMEFNAWNILQLRLGYQKNLADTGAVEALGLSSVGIGLSVFGVHLDVAAVGNENDVGILAELGLRF